MRYGQDTEESVNDMKWKVIIKGKSGIYIGQRRDIWSNQWVRDCSTHWCHFFLDRSFKLNFGKDGRDQRDDDISLFVCVIAIVEYTVHYLRTITQRKTHLFMNYWFIKNPNVEQLMSATDSLCRLHTVKKNCESADTTFCVYKAALFIFLMLMSYIKLLLILKFGIYSLKTNFRNPPLKTLPFCLKIELLRIISPKPSGGGPPDLPPYSVC
jgi:hypothetical protein